MKHYSMACVIGVVLCIGAQAQTAPEIKGAVEKSLGYLTQRTLAWKDGHSCASCHHAPLMLWTAYEARKKGHAIDATSVETIRQWLLSDDNAARILPAKDGPPDRYIFSLSSAYNMLALAAALPEEQDAAAIQRYREHYIAKQEADGSYLINGSFPGTAPILEGGSTGTTMARLALGALPGLTPEQEATAQKADAWLAAHPPTDRSLQEHALRLFLVARSGTRDAVPPLAAALLSLQHPGGGWSQAPELQPDAYATGQALLALGNVGMRAHEPPIADAIDFLLRTQLPTGEWPMASRTVRPDGSGAKNLEPITAAAAAWATLGLIAVE